MRGRGQHYGNQSGVNQMGAAAQISEQQRMQWRWDRDGQKGSGFFNEHGKEADASRNVFQNQRLNSQPDMDRRSGRDMRYQAHLVETDRDMRYQGLQVVTDRDMRYQSHQMGNEVGYDGNAFPQTLEGLEQKFLQELVKLTKEQEDAEDAENARHREKLGEINAQYQENLVAMRARQAAHRDEFLRRESQSRHQQYQEANMTSYHNTVLPDEGHGFRLGGAASHFDSDAQHPEYAVRGRGSGFEARSPYPGGRAYNTGGRHF